MKQSKYSIELAGVIVALFQATAAIAHEGDLFVGRDGSNRLVIEFDFDETQPLAFVNGLLTGCTSDFPGFATLDEDEPDENFFTLDGGAFVVLEVVSVSAGFKAWTPGFVTALDSPGQQWQVGPPVFDTHLVWHIDSTHPSYDPGAVYSMTFKLIDTGSTGYSESEPYTLTFQCAARGACCMKVGCEEEFEDRCGEEGGVYLGDGTQCDVDGGSACPDVWPIPTVSEWGMVVLALTVLIGGTVLLIDRRGKTCVD